MRLRGLGLLLACLACADSDPAIHVHPGESIQAAVERAQAGDRVVVHPGVYHETVYIDRDGVHLQGRVSGGERAVLDGRGELNDGVLVAGHGVTVEGLHVRRYKGNGIMTQGVNDFRILDNRVEGPSFYGIFPQFGRSGLVEGNEVREVEDAAIYVSMSQHVDVRHNRAEDSVLGIESENSRDILIEDNVLRGNRIGIALTLVPGRVLKRASGSIVRRNSIGQGDPSRTGRASSLAAAFPAGVGVFLWSVDGATIEDNEIRDQVGAAIRVSDHASVPAAATDPETDPSPDRNRVLANRLAGNRVDLEVDAPGRDNCLRPREDLRIVGAAGWSACPRTATSAAVRTHRLPEPIPLPDDEPGELGELTWAGICAGCHALDGTRVGPSAREIRAAWAGRPEALADWIAAPEKKRPELPEMPPQNYLSPEVRLAVARYVLEAAPR